MLNSSPEYARLSVGVLHHHERIDGEGYPNKIKRHQIWCLFILEVTLLPVWHYYFLNFSMYFYPHPIYA
jgi:hypothetical protein